MTTTMPAERSGLRLAGLTLLASGVLAAVGIAFLVAMFTAFATGARSAGLAFGRVNDTLVLISYLLAAPAVVAMHTLLRPRWQAWSTLLALIGIGAIVAIVVLQGLLITEVLTFDQQVGPVSVALLVLGAWFVVTGYLGAKAGILPRGARIGLLAAAYVGYPVWAVRLGRRLLAPAGEPVLGVSAPQHP